MRVLLPIGSESGAVDESGRLQHDLSAIEALGVFPRRPRLHTTEPQQRPEEVRRKPIFISLSLKMGHEQADLFLAGRVVQVNEEIGGTHIAVPLRDFIFEDEVIPEGIPGQLRHDPMILVEIVPVMSEHDIRRLVGLQLFKELLDLFRSIWEEAGLEAFDGDVSLVGMLQEAFSTHRGLSVSFAAGAEYDPAHSGLRIFRDQA